MGHNSGEVVTAPGGGFIKKRTKTPRIIGIVEILVAQISVARVQIKSHGGTNITRVYTYIYGIWATPHVSTYRQIIFPPYQGGFIVSLPLRPRSDRNIRLSRIVGWVLFKVYAKGDRTTANRRTQR